MKARGLSTPKKVITKPVAKPTVSRVAAQARTVQKPASMAYSEVLRPSPNVGGVIKPEGIILHHSCGTWLGDQSWILKNESKVSYHCLINISGERVKFVKYNRQAWHAGKSTFKGRSGCNSFMLGLAFAGDTVSGLRRPSKSLTADEVASAVEWIHFRMKEFGITKDWITTHAIVSPGRKDDVSPAAYRQIMDAL